MFPRNICNNTVLTKQLNKINKRRFLKISMEFLETEGELVTQTETSQICKQLGNMGTYLGKY